MLYLPRRIYEPLKGIVVVSGWEKKARITNNFACIKRTRNQMQSVDRMIHGAASGKVLTWGGPPPPLRGVEGLLKWCFVADDSFGLLWSPVRSFHSHDETFFISRHRNGSSDPTEEAAPRWCPPPMKEGTKIFNLHVACCRAATASAVIASLNYSFFTTILWIHIKF